MNNTVLDFVVGTCCLTDGLVDQTAQSSAKRQGYELNTMCDIIYHDGKEYGNNTTTF